MSGAACKVIINSETKDGLTVLGSAMDSFDGLLASAAFSVYQEAESRDASDLIDAAIALDREVQEFVFRATQRYRKINLELAKRLP